MALDSATVHGSASMSVTRQLAANMPDSVFASELADRLNRLADSDAGARELLTAMLNARFPVDAGLAERHETLQVGEWVDDGGVAGYGVNLLGVLNALTGTLDGCENAGCGLLCAHVREDDGGLLRFALTPRDPREADSKAAAGISILLG